MPTDMPPGTIAVVCQQCGTRLFATAGSAGKQAKCAKCGAMTDVPAITIVRVISPTVHSPPTAKPVATEPAKAKGIPIAKPVSATPAKAKPASAKTEKASPKAKPSHAAAHAPAPARSLAASAPVAAPIMRTQATKISQETLAKFGKLAPSQNGAPRSAADSWAAPDGPVRVWGQLRTAGTPSEPSQTNAPEKAAENAGLAGRAAAVVDRVPRRWRLPACIAAGVLVIVLAYVSYAALSGPGDGAGGLGSNWTPLDYATRAAGTGKEPGSDSGDTKVLVRIKFDVRFSNLLGLAGDDWEVRDASKGDRQQPYNVSFTPSDAANRIGTLGFIVSGSWRPKDISIHAKQEDAWLPLDTAKPNP
jgi:hypothetical protein